MSTPSLFLSIHFMEYFQSLNFSVLCLSASSREHIMNTFTLGLWRARQDLLQRWEMNGMENSVLQLIDVSSFKMYVVIQYTFIHWFYVWENSIFRKASKLHFSKNLSQSTRVNLSGRLVQIFYFFSALHQEFIKRTYIWGMSCTAATLRGYPVLCGRCRGLCWSGHGTQGCWGMVSTSLSADLPLSWSL